MFLICGIASAMQELYILVLCKDFEIAMAGKEELCLQHFSRN
jgi:hypothetical protein